MECGGKITGKITRRRKGRKGSNPLEGGQMRMARGGGKLLEAAQPSLHNSPLGHGPFYIAPWRETCSVGFIVSAYVPD